MAVSVVVRRVKTRVSQTVPAPVAAEEEYGDERLKARRREMVATGEYRLGWGASKPGGRSALSTGGLGGLV